MKNCPEQISQVKVKDIDLYLSDVQNAQQFAYANGIHHDPSKKDDPSGRKSSIDIIVYCCCYSNESAQENYAGARWAKESGNYNQSLKKLFGSKNIATSYLKAHDVSGEMTLKQLYEILPRTQDQKQMEYIQKIAQLIGLDDKGEDEMNTTTGSTTNTEERLIDLIQNGQYQIILTGAPGTGKTYMSDRVARQFVREQVEDRFIALGMEADSLEEEIAAALKERIKMVQFHPSYDYTDFVEGLRPISDKDGSKDDGKDDGRNNSMRFEKMDGTFKAFCRMVAENNDEMDQEDWPLYFFLIDEINRADLSKVFGELMFCMEKDKRGTTIYTQYHNLPTYGIEGKDVFEDGFFIPPNVVIIGTMNDIDRSVESMDFALRRRFVWEEVRVDEDLLTTVFRTEKFFEGRGYIEDLARQIKTFNDAMKEEVTYLNSGYDISQGQFSNMPESEKGSLEDVLRWVWNYRVESLLKEYLRGDGQLTEHMNKLRVAWFPQSSQGKTNDQPAEDKPAEGGEA